MVLLLLMAAGGVVLCVLRARSRSEKKVREDTDRVSDSIRYEGEVINRAYAYVEEVYGAADRVYDTIQDVEKHINIDMGGGGGGSGGGGGGGGGRGGGGGGGGGAVGSEDVENLTYTNPNVGDGANVEMVKNVAYGRVGASVKHLSYTNDLGGWVMLKGIFRTGSEDDEECSIQPCSQEEGVHGNIQS